MKIPSGGKKAYLQIKEQLKQKISQSKQEAQERIKQAADYLTPKAKETAQKAASWVDDKINDPKIRKEDLGNGNYMVLNTSQNQYAGYSAESDIVSISLTKAAAQNSRYNNITESTMFKDNYFIDRVITEKDIIKK